MWSLYLAKFQLGIEQDCSDEPQSNSTLRLPVSQRGIGSMPLGSMAIQTRQTDLLHSARR